jgi:hypothetical protein
MRIPSRKIIYFLGLDFAAKQSIIDRKGENYEEG